MNKLLLLSFLTFTIITSRAQNADCKVLLNSLKGTYTGDCKNGKADGKGKIAGVDSYEGQFKNGLPDGEGKYTWANGDYYSGGWKKGLKDGKGEMHSLVNNQDNVIYGFWNKGTYKGKYEQPYIIYNTSSSTIGRVDVSKIKSNRLSITIEVLSMTGGGGVSSTTPTSNNNVATSTSTKAASLTEIRVQTGTFNTKAVNKLSNREINVLQNVIFPFKAVFVFDNSLLEMEILEEGDWTVVVPIQQ